MINYGLKGWSRVVKDAALLRRALDGECRRSFKRQQLCLVDGAEGLQPEFLRLNECAGRDLQTGFPPPRPPSAQTSARHVAQVVACAENRQTIRLLVRPALAGCSLSLFHKNWPLPGSEDPGQATRRESGQSWGRRCDTPWRFSRQTPVPPRRAASGSRAFLPPVPMRWRSLNWS